MSASAARSSFASSLLIVALIVFGFLAARGHRLGQVLMLKEHAASRFPRSKSSRSLGTTSQSSRPLTRRLISGVSPSKYFRSLRSSARREQFASVAIRGQESRHRQRNRTSLYRVSCSVGRPWASAWASAAQSCLVASGTSRRLSFQSIAACSVVPGHAHNE